VVAAARERCEEVGARVVEATAGETPTPPVNLASYAARDVRLGLRAAEVLLDRALSREERKQAGRSVLGMLPSRFEVHEVGGVPVVVDGGHNPPGVRATLEAVRSAYGGRPLGMIFGVLRAKDIESMLTGLQKQARVLVLTLPEGERAADPAHLSASTVHGTAKGGGLGWRPTS
jgi:dihydrofolate synthase/folylpolyglutamate synthase